MFPKDFPLETHWVETLILGRAAVLALRPGGTVAPEPGPTGVPGSVRVDSAVPGLSPPGPARLRPPRPEPDAAAQPPRQLPSNLPGNARLKGADGNSALTATRGRSAVPRVCSERPESHGSCSGDGLALSASGRSGRTERPPVPPARSRVGAELLRGTPTPGGPRAPPGHGAGAVPAGRGGGVPEPRAVGAGACRNPARLGL